MKKARFIKFIGLFLVVVILSIILVLNKKENNDSKDTVKFEGKTYVLLEYNMDVFTYNFISNDYYEEDLIHPVSHDKWDVVYFEGDLFVLDKQVEEATRYYADDKNYEWFVIFETEEAEIKKPLPINDEELKYLYNMENLEKSQTTTFDDIKQFADIVKVSKDGFIQALVNLVQCEDAWYWKTEIMNDNDEEYIIDLPDSLNEKIQLQYER